MILAHKIRLKPNKQQLKYLAKSAGIARFAYNWALSEWKNQYETGLKPSEGALRKQLNSIKREQYPWMLEVSKCCPQQAIMNLGIAYKNAFHRIKTGQRTESEDNPWGFPTFKKKGKHDSFTLDNINFKIENRKVRMPNIGWISMREKLRFNGKLMRATVSRIADHWYISIAVETDDFSHLKPTENQGVVGVDLGCRKLATLSDGTVIQGPKPHKALLNRLRRLNKSLSQKKLGSRNRYKARMKLAKLHHRIACIRNDNLHKLTSELTRCHDIIGIEDLNVRGMTKNKRLSRSILDMGFGEFRRQLEYKSLMRGNHIHVADRFYPSSKTCSICGFKNDQLKMEEYWTCPNCAAKHDRDLNAAINLKNLAVRSTVAACGVESSGAEFVQCETIDCEAGIFSNVNVC